MTLDDTTDTSSAHTATSRARPVYLDCNATTPPDPEVLAEVVRYLSEDFGNAGSRTHLFGQSAKERVNRAREQVAAVADAEPDEVVFTSGATESNNIAILGLEAEGHRSGRKHVVTTAIEHKAVLEPVERLRQRGFEVSTVAPQTDGRVRAEDILAAIRVDTLLVSVMAANNETGTVQPVAEIAAGLQQHDAYLHVDAAQAFGKVLEPLRSQRIDMISLSAHKLYGPKGVGALIARRRGYKRAPLTPLIIGGGQERGLRPGTLPVALIAGLGTAAMTAVRDHGVRQDRCLELRQGLLTALTHLKPQINGNELFCLPHTLNFSIPNLDSEAAIVALKEIAAVSNGSACTSQSYDPSHVLVAMNLPEERVQGALRFSWSHLTETPDWDRLIGRFTALI